MSCQGIAGIESMEDRLNDYVGGYLSAEEARQVEQHVRECAGCGETLRELRSLLAEVESLPKNISPPPALWPELRSTLRNRMAGGQIVRMTPRTTAEWFRPALAAAAVIIMVAAAAVTLMPEGVVTMDPVAGTGGGVAGSIVPAGAGFLPEITAAEEQFNLATANLLEALEMRRGEIPPETLRVVEESMEEINQAIARARGALEKDPANARLGYMVTAMHRKKVNLLKGAVGLPAPSL